MPPRRQKTRRSRWCAVGGKRAATSSPCWHTMMLCAAHIAEWRGQAQTPSVYLHQYAPCLASGCFSVHTAWYSTADAQQGLFNTSIPPAHTCTLSLLDCPHTPLCLSPPSPPSTLFHRPMPDWQSPPCTPTPREVGAPRAGWTREGARQQSAAACF